MRFKLLSVILSSLILGACSSTNRDYGVVVESTKDLTWDNDESFALNVSRMGNPADLGLGLVDVNNPEAMEIDRDANSVFSFYSGFVAGGILGGLGALSMDSEIKKNRSWKPYFVQFIPTYELDIKADDSGKFVQDRLYQSVSSAVEKTFKNTITIGVYTNPKDSSLSPFENIVLLEGEACKQAFSAERTDDFRSEGWADYYRSHVGGDVPTTEARCTIPVSSSMTGILNNHYVITHEVIAITSSLYLANKIANESDMAFVHPDYYRAKDVNTGKTIEHNLKSPFVSYNGSIYLFDRAEVSKPIL